MSRPAGQVRPEAVSQFRRVAEVDVVSPDVLDRMRTLDEKAELEPKLMAIVGEVDETPHGPTELADQLTVHLDVLGEPRFSAIVTKGKATQQVRAKDVTYQLARAARVPQVDLLVLAAIGDIQDDVKADLALIGGETRDWMILDRRDLARLFVAYGQMCPNDGEWLEGALCARCGYQAVAPLPAAAARFALLSVEDKSWGLAKRFSANVWVQTGLSRADLTTVLMRIVEQVRAESYVRNEMVRKTHGDRPADVVWVFAYEDPADQPLANWTCRAIWVAPTLSEKWAPTRFGQPAPGHPHLWVDWRENTSAIRDLFDGRRMDKGTYLRAVDQFIAEAPQVIESARRLLTGSLTEAAEHQLSELGELAARLSRPDEQRVAPYELTDLDNAYAVVDSHLGNLFLPFDDRGRATWDARARAAIARSSLEHLDDDWQKLLIERKRVK